VLAECNRGRKGGSTKREVLLKNSKSQLSVATTRTQRIVAKKDFVNIYTEGTPGIAGPGD